MSLAGFRMLCSGRARGVTLLINGTLSQFVLSQFVPAGPASAANTIISGASRIPVCDSMSKRAEAPSMVMSSDFMAGNCLSVIQV